MRCSLIPFFETNYLFALTSEARPGEAVLTDPGDPVTAELFLAHEGLHLSAILITHHHPDHIGGVERLRARYHCEVYGAAEDARRLPPLTRPLREGDAVTIFGETGHVMALPGHTTGLIAYYFPESGMLFSGDLIFGMGCGRMFEGTPEEFHNSFRRVAQLPPQTLIYGSHEYLEDNADFCADYFKNDPLYAKELEAARRIRAGGKSTVPMKLEDELRRNPFMRASSPEEFGRLRAARNAFIPSPRRPPL